MEFIFCEKDAINYGVNKAVLLSIVKSKLKECPEKINGFNWVKISSKQISDEFNFFKQSSIRRWMAELEKEGVLESESFGLKSFDNTKFYRML